MILRGLVFLLILFSGFVASADTIVALPGLRQSGSGVHMGNGVIYTARHVLHGMLGQVQDEFQGVKPLPGGLSKYNLLFAPSLSELDRDSFANNNRINFSRIQDYNDWVILKNEIYASLPRPTSTRSPATLVQGETVFIHGKPELYDLRILQGTFESMEGNNFLIRLNSLRGGFSGGGVFDSNGALLGIVFGWHKNQGLGSVTSIDVFPTLKLFIPNNLTDKKY